jgi:hypothetical protein
MKHRQFSTSFVLRKTYLTITLCSMLHLDFNNLAIRREWFKNLKRLFKCVFRVPFCIHFRVPDALFFPKKRSKSLYPNALLDAFGLSTLQAVVVKIQNYNISKCEFRGEISERILTDMLPSFPPTNIILSLCEDVVMICQSRIWRSA